MTIARRQGAQPIADILSELVARRGLARVRTLQYLEDAWRTVVGEHRVQSTRVGVLRRGTLEISVANSVLLHELAAFEKQTLLAKLRETLGTDELRELRFRLDERM